VVDPQATNDTHDHKPATLRIVILASVEHPVRMRSATDDDGSRSKPTDAIRQLQSVVGLPAW